MRPHLVHWLDHLLPPHVAALLAPTWFTLVGLAGAIALILILRAARRTGDDAVAIATAMLWGYVAAVVAGIAVPMLADLLAQAGRGSYRLRWAGMTSFWGYLGGLAATVLVLRRGAVPLGRFGDLAAVPLGAALVLARLGCFVAGCDYGAVTSAPWAVRFPAGSPAWRDHVRAGLVPPDRGASLPVHPTQLYEAGLGLAMIAVAIWAARQPWARRAHGRVFLAVAATYAVGRLGIEVLRGDLGRGFVGALSSGQIFSLVALAAITAALVLTRRRAVAAVLAMAAIAVVPRPAAAEEKWLEAGALLGVSAPLNRRENQVDPLAGPSASLGLGLGHGLSLWVDLDSQSNQDATHGTVLASFGFHLPSGKSLRIGGRFGAGSTLVNFRDEVFRDVGGLTMRAEAIGEYAISDHWVLWVRPIALDLLTANDLGGPILTWQLRAGIAFRYGLGPKQPAASTPPPAAPPPQPYQPGQLVPYSPPQRPAPAAPPQPMPSPYDPPPGGTP